MSRPAALAPIPAPRREAAEPSAGGPTRRLAASFGKRGWIALLVLVAALAHGVNMDGFPYYESDEGTYMAQAWAVARQGRLSPYTYVYDHAPLGWVQLAGWVVLSGGFAGFGSAIDTGRALMWVLQVGSALLVFGIAWRLSSSTLAASIAALVFALSPYGLYYHRRVLLDNVSAFWMLVSIALALRRPLDWRAIALSAAALGVSILSKEVALVVAPALAALVALRAGPGRHHAAAALWLGAVAAVVAVYPLMALSRGELLPTPEGFGASPRASLVDTLVFQMGRGRDGGILDPASQFWALAARWAEEEPFLAVVGTLAAVAAVARWRHDGATAAIGAAALSLWLFLARGGQVLPFYLVPALPLLAVCAGVALDRAAATLGRVPRAGPGGMQVARAALAALCLGLVAAGYRSPTLGFRDNPLSLWTNRQAEAQRQAIAWVEEHVIPDGRLLVDPFIWTDLRDAPTRADAFLDAYPYWTADRDALIRHGVFRDDWRTVQYVVATPQVWKDAQEAGLSLVADALANSRPVATFDTGGWPVEVRRVSRLGGVPPEPRAEPAR